MTKEQLQKHHYNISKPHSDIHANESIEYAISVLEEVKKTLSHGSMRYPLRDVELKITELESLIK